MHPPESDDGPRIEASSGGQPSRSFAVPTRLTSDHRLEFRRLALEALELAASSSAKYVAIDLGAVIEIDASGLGVLILVQKRARERGMRVRLERVPMAVAALLDATRLEPLFEIERAH